MYGAGTRGLIIKESSTSRSYSLSTIYGRKSHHGFHCHMPGKRHAKDILHALLHNFL